MTGNPASVNVLALAGCLVSLGCLAAAGTARAQPEILTARKWANPFHIDMDALQQGIHGAPSSKIQLAALDAPDVVNMPQESMQPAQGSAGTAGQLFDFNLPAQPLSAALNRYADISGQPALFPSEAVVGRMSSAVHGRYTSEAALHLLLEGTGLTAEKRHSALGDTFILRVADSRPAVTGKGLNHLFSDEGYPGALQARIWQALCANARTAPHRYSAMLRFHVDADGRIRDARLIESSGDGPRDAALLEIVQGVRIDQAPPAAIVQQPLTMMILPKDPFAAPQCSPEAERKAP